MKLKRIQLSNCYGHRETDVELDDVDAAVIAGPNGAGKSSLIAYGPLFALYGRPAVQGDSYSDVVTHGATEATASVTFEIGGETYRVTRTYSEQTKRGSSSLEFVRRDDSGEWTPEATGSIREIESAIVETLGVEYQTMTVGSVQLQGEAAKFTTATSSERIELLAEILGVEYLREAFTEAGRRKRATADRIDELSADLEAREELLSSVDEKADELADLRDRLDTLSKPTGTDRIDDQIDALEARRDELADVADEYDALREEYDDRREAISDLSGEIADRKEKLSEKKTRAEFLADDADVDEVHGFETVEAARSAGESLRETYDEAETAADKLELLRTAVEDKRDELDRVSERLGRLSGRARNALDTLEDRLETTELSYPVDGDDLEARAGAIDDDLDDLRERWESFEERNESIVEASNELERDWNRYEERRENLEQTAAAIDERNDDVPLEDCEACGLLANAVEAREKLEDDDRREELQARAEELQAREETLAEDRREAGLEYRSDYREARSELESERNALERAAEDLDALEGRLGEIRDLRDRWLRLQSEMRETVSKAAEIEDEWDLDDDELPTDGIEDDLADAREAFTELQQRDNAREELEELESEIDTLESEIADREERVEELTENQSETRERLEVLARTKAEIDAAREWLEAAQKRRAKIVERNQKRHNARAELQREITEVETTILGLLDRLREIDEKGLRIEELETDKANLEYAREFFRAAPQLVIGSAIPELERRANDLLDDLFPEITLRVRRQKQTESGGTSDKLHLRILRRGTDQPYAAFSGGEQFLIDVAVRLGLARAASGRQAASPIRTLILDEGFGALDPDNVSEVKSALLKLTSRFRQLFVISHVPEVRDALGTVLQIEPTADGTSVEIVT